jgi:hypothetical protein
MSDFGAFLGKISGKIANVANSDRKLKCYGCDKITDHITISYADVLKAADNHKNDVWRDANGIYMDFSLALSPIIIGNPYACNDCKRIRFEGGVMSNTVNDGFPKYL